MADFSLTTLFVVPGTTNSYLSGSATQDLAPGQIGVYDNNYNNVSNHASGILDTDASVGPYFYIAQGRNSNYLQGSKRSDKIAGCNQAVSCQPNVFEWYKVVGCPTPVNQITVVDNFTARCGDTITLTLRAHSSYIDTLYFNGLTRSVTVQAPCCDCGADPCDTIDENVLINLLIEKLEQTSTASSIGGVASPAGINPDNISLNNFFTFTNVGGTALQIEGKALTKYGQPCDVAAFPFEFDRLWFNTFVYSGPATTADFIVADNCNIVADVNVTQTSNYARGTSEEIIQLEKNFYSYQTGFLKHLYRMAGYNQAFESFVATGATYTTYYIRFNEYGRGQYNFGDYITLDSTVIIAVPTTNTNFSADLEATLVPALGAVVSDGAVCITTTTSSTTIPA
jgi:hypothetical protein